MVENSNPLNKYFRQPSVYIKLPSDLGYSKDVIDMTSTTELPVSPMTAMDEIKFKTPDALMNGQGVVDVIQSCIPDIKDAWQISNYDLDSILIAIRIATYGETMNISFTVPGTTEKVDHSLNLPALLDDIKKTTVKNEITLKDGLRIAVRPLTYKDMTSTALQTFTQQKLYSTVQNADMAPEEKVKRFNESFKALTDLSHTILLKNISKIITIEGVEVTDPTQIKEFVEKANATLIKELQDELVNLRTQGAVQPIKLKASEEQIKKVAPASYEIPVTFDTANFFV